MMRNWRSPAVGYRFFVALFTTAFWEMGVRGLHNLEINVPPAVLVGETVSLECSWQLEDEEALYSVKWYRGREEFYRYIPKEMPHTRVFPLPGIEVDISRSGARRVVLQEATPAMAGRFRCEVSADAPTFHTEIRSAPLDVVDPPEWHPKLVSDRSWYGVGSTLRATCASPPATPAANLTVAVNGIEIDVESFGHELPDWFKWDPLPKAETTTIEALEEDINLLRDDANLQYLDETYVNMHEEVIRRPAKEIGRVFERTGPDTRQVSVAEVAFLVTSGSFERGTLRLTCVASIYNLYAARAELIFDMEQPEVASVLGVRNSANNSKVVKDSKVMKEQVIINERVRGLKQRAAARFQVSIEDCHLGHVALQAMLEEPDLTHQIDAHNDGRESNGSVALRSCKLASAMRNYGLVAGDTMVIIGPNHLDLCIPYFASHYNGYQMCAMDPSVITSDLKILFSYINPKMVFCPKSHVENVNTALTECNFEAKLICFDDEDNSVEKFVEEYRGTEVNFKPAVFDQKKLNAWLMMTSGTTGLPKLAMLPYETLLTGLCSWWSHFTDRIHVNLAMGTIQWMSSLIFFISGPLMRYTRVQSSVPLSPQLLVKLINTYKPNATAWTPHMLGKFIEAAGDFCDLSSFVYIAIGGSSIEKPLLDAFKAKCGAFLFLVYGMTELLVPVFEYNDHTPFGSTGKELDKFQYRLVSDEGDALDKDSNATGELWIKGDEFFKGYLNNPEETDKVISSDGWVKTGDMFFRDSEGYYYFVERKRLMIKCRGLLVSPLQLEDVIKEHPAVHDVCVVGIPDPAYMELPVAAVVRNEEPLDPEEIFDLLKSKLPEYKQLYGGLFFMDALPETPSGKVHRAKIREIAFVTPRILPKQPLLKE